MVLGSFAEVVGSICCLLRGFVLFYLHSVREKCSNRIPAFLL